MYYFCILVYLLSLFPSEANCSAPPPPADGSIDSYTSRVPGAKVTFQCDEGFSPSGLMTAVCQASGNWEPDPAAIVCSTSG